MKTLRSSPGRSGARAAGFTLIELIAVMAIISILAATLAPTTLRTIEQATINAESTTVRHLGERVKLYVRDVGTPPTAASWITQLAPYVDLGPTDLLTNRRKNNRVFLLDPAASPAPRVIILSSMYVGLSLPTAATINTATKFQDIWQTADGSIPTAVSWSGWSSWSSVARASDYLVIERVNLQPVYKVDLQSLTITLNNRSTTSVSYRVIYASGGTALFGVINPSGAPVILNLHPRDQVNLYKNSAGTSLDYTYVLSSSAKTFDFTTQWLPQ